MDEIKQFPDTMEMRIRRSLNIPDHNTDLVPDGCKFADGVLSDKSLDVIPYVMMTIEQHLAENEKLEKMIEDTKRD